MTPDDDADFARRMAIIAWAEAMLFAAGFVSLVMALDPSPTNLWVYAVAIVVFTLWLPLVFALFALVWGYKAMRALRRQGRTADRALAAAAAGLLLIGGNALSCGGLLVLADIPRLVMQAVR